MKDPRLAKLDPEALPSDCKRMAYGGFEVLVDAFAVVPDRVKRSEPGQVSNSQPAHLD
jgi:hypothetical protein